MTSNLKTRGFVGYYNVVKNKLERDVIPRSKRFPNMVIKTRNDGKHWVLKSPPWAKTEADWIPVGNNDFIYSENANLNNALGGNVYNASTITTLLTKLQTLLGVKTVYIDGNMTIPDNNNYLLTDVRFIGTQSNQNNTLTIPYLANLRNVLEFRNIKFVAGAGGAGQIQVGYLNNNNTTLFHNCVIDSVVRPGGPFIKAVGADGNIELRNTTLTGLSSIKTFGAVSPYTLNIDVNSLIGQLNTTYIPQSSLDIPVGSTFNISSRDIPNTYLVHATQIYNLGTLNNLGVTPLSINVIKGATNVNVQTLNIKGDYLNFTAGELNDITINSISGLAVQANAIPYVPYPTINFTGNIESITNEPGFPGTGATIKVAPNGIMVSDNVTTYVNTNKINLKDNGVTTVYNGGTSTVDVTIPGLNVKNNNVAIASLATYDIVGPRHTAVYDGGNNKVSITVANNQIFKDFDAINYPNAIQNATLGKVNFTSNSPALTVVNGSQLDVNLPLSADAEIIHPQFEAELIPSASLVENGTSLSALSFIAKRNYLATTVNLTNSLTAENKNVLTQFNAGTPPNIVTPTSSSIFTTDEISTHSNISITFTLSSKRTINTGIFQIATQPKIEFTSTSLATITFTRKVYASAAIPGTLDAAFILALTGTLQETKNGTYTITAGAGQKIYIAYKNDYGPSTFTVDGFTGGFTLISSTISVSNGFTSDSYYLYESDTANLGTCTFTVS